MSRQRKNIIFLIVTLAVLGGLAGVYFWRQSADAKAEAEAAAQPTEEPVNLRVIERGEGAAEVTQIEYINEHGSVKFSPKQVDGERDWYFTDYPNVPVNQSTADSMAYFATAFTASSLMLESAENLAEYGLGPDASRAVATYADGGMEVIRVGSQTPDRSYYYMTVEGNPALYLLNSTTGERFSFTYSDVVDRAVPAINKDSYEYILINERGREPVEFDFIGTDEEREQMLTDYGTLVLDMITPYYGRELYMTSLSLHVLEGLEGMALGEMVEIDAADLSVYGLDEPSMEFWYISGENEIHLLLGDRTDDGNIYAKLFGRSEVFLMEYASVESLYGLDPLSVVEKFIALVNILECESIVVEHPDPSMNFELVMNHEVLPPEEGEEEGEEIIRPEINGIAVNEEDFRDVYRYIIGLTTDKEGGMEKPETPPLFTIIFNMIDAEPIELAFYEYDVNFYNVWREGSAFMSITNKQSVDTFFKGAAALLAAPGV